MTQYRIRNWHQFQHFKDRRPPWIKLYRSLLDDPEWGGLCGDHAKALVALWLIASDQKEPGTLPKPAALAYRMRISVAELESVISGLNHWVERDDITTISRRYRDDAPETETETETETEREREGEHPPAPQAAQGQESTIPPDATHADDYRRTISALSGRLTCDYSTWLSAFRASGLPVNAGTVDATITAMSLRPSHEWEKYGNRLLAFAISDTAKNYGISRKDAAADEPRKRKAFNMVRWNVDLEEVTARLERGELESHLRDSWTGTNGPDGRHIVDWAKERAKIEAKKGKA